MGNDNENTWEKIYSGGNEFPYFLVVSLYCNDEQRPSDLIEINATLNRPNDNFADLTHLKVSHAPLTCCNLLPLITSQ